jgi:hypothetical protein
MSEKNYFKSVDKIVENWHKITSPVDNTKLCWALEKCQSKFYQRGSKWYFQNEKDATLFLLKFGTFNDEDTTF